MYVPVPNSVRCLSAFCAPWQGHGGHYPPATRRLPAPSARLYTCGQPSITCLAQPHPPQEVLRSHAQAFLRHLWFIRPPGLTTTHALQFTSSDLWQPGLLRRLKVALNIEINATLLSRPKPSLRMPLTNGPSSGRVQKRRCSDASSPRTPAKILCRAHGTRLPRPAGY